MAYFLINKDTEQTIIAIDTTKVAELIGVHRHTVTNRFNKSAGNKIETDKYIIYKANIYYEHEKSSGNKDSKEVKYKKANGEIDCVHPKKIKRRR